MTRTSQGCKGHLVPSRREVAPAAGALHSEQDWTALMTRALEGDGVAYRRLVQEVRPYLRSLVSRFHRDARDIEDTIQDILLSLHAARHSYDPSRPFGPWLVGIAHRRAVDGLRRQGRRRRYEVPLTAEHDAIPEAPIDGELIFGRCRLLGAVDMLPPVQQRAIRLLKLDELSLQAAAAETRMSITALKVATHRAMRSLRGRLAYRIGA